MDLKKKKCGTGVAAYLMLFVMALMTSVIVVYLFQMARLMTQQHHIDDALADAVLASLVADDVYFFETKEEDGETVLRLRSTDYSYDVFTDCMRDEVSESEDFYHNFAFDEFICYEVEDGYVLVTTYAGDTGVKSTAVGVLGTVKTPTGKTVERTSAYGKVRFDIENIISGNYITKTRDCYCTLETEDQEEENHV